MIKTTTPINYPMEKFEFGLHVSSTSLRDSYNIQKYVNYRLCVCIGRRIKCHNTCFHDDVIVKWKCSCFLVL